MAAFNTDAYGIAFALQCYGEEGLGEKAKRLSKANVSKVCQRASVLILANRWWTASGWDKGFALAAVELFEGKSRELRRDRRALGDASPKRQVKAPRPKLRSVPLQSPRQIYREVCADIAAALATDGFKFRKGPPHLIRQRGAWMERIVFSTSHYNDPDAVHLRVDVTATRPELEEARGDFPWGASPGAALGQLGKVRGWNAPDLAAPSTRGNAVASVVEGIRSVALPWFDSLHDVERLVRRAKARALPGIEDARLVIILLASGRKDLASEHLRGRRRLKSELYPELEALARYHKLPRPKRG
jgi:hypothetical protein